MGDLSQVSDKWGPSIGLFQIRSLRHPDDYPYPDTLRIASDLRDPLTNAKAALAIQQRYSWDAWSVYRNETHLGRIGQDYTIRTGHPRADEWSK